MQEADYCLLAERLAQCEDLAAHARDRGVREKAAELAAGYRNLIASADRLSRNKWAIFGSNSIAPPRTSTAQEPQALPR